MMSEQPAYPGIPDVTNGNGAVAHVMKLVCGGLIGYPITPSTEIAEIFEAGRAEGQVNIFGRHPFFVEAEGEHSAQSGALGAAMTGGNYISNASSAQGILYALESHYVTAGKKIGGFVLQVAARVVTRHSLNVMAGHEDVYSLLPAGYTILFGSDPQEAADLAAIAYRTSSLSLIPVANAMDGFATSHVMSEVQLPEPEMLKTYLGYPNGRIACPTVAQEILFGAKGRVDYLNRWLSSKAELNPDAVAAPRQWLANHADEVEQDNEAGLVSEVLAFLPDSVHAGFTRAWKSAWPKGTRQRVPALIDPFNPGLVGGVQNQVDFQAGSADHRTHFASEVPRLVRQAMQEYAELTGRSYAPVQRYGPADADLILVGMGSITDDARALLDYFASQNLKVAVVSVKLLNPFPTRELVSALIGARRVTVLERAEDTVLTRAVKQSLFEAGASAANLHVMTAIFGLGSHDVQPRDLIAVVRHMITTARTPVVYIGSQFFVPNPATPALAAVQDRMRAAYPATEAMALPTQANPPGLLPPQAIRIRFHSVGGYGTVATGKLLTDMLSSMLNMHSKSAPKYGSEKSGAPTNFYITLSPEPVLFTNSSLEDVEIVVSPDHKVFEHDRPLRGLVDGGTFILQTSLPPLEAWMSLPVPARQEIRNRRIQFLVIDAFAVAKAHAPTPNLETRMMGVAFIGAIIGHVERITQSSNREYVSQLIREELEKKFGSKGQAVVEANMAVISDAIKSTQAVAYSQPEYESATQVSTLALALTPRLVPSTGIAPDRVYDQAYFDDMLGQPFREGWAGSAPVLPGTGSFIPPATAAAKNKGLFRRELPVVDIAKCTACLECALACPDSAIPNQAHEIADLIASAIQAADLSDQHKAYLIPFVPQWADKARAHLLADTTIKDLSVAVRVTAGVIPNIDDHHLETIVVAMKTFPAARIRPIFDQMEKKQAGSGGFYSVVVDPWKCTGCLQCVEVCGPGALSAAEQTDDLVRAAQTKFERLTDLPNTPARFTAGVYAPGGDTKRLLMNHNNYYALAGGHGACKGCGEVTATHLVTSLVQGIGEDTRAQHITGLESWISGLSSKLDLADDERAARLRRLINQLETQLWRYEAGPTGSGPASSVIINSTGCSSVYGSTFPNNPFTQPWFNSLFQDAQASAVGVFEGLASQYVDQVRAQRAAELELADAYNPAVHDQELALLSWRQFTSQELLGMPKVLTISGDGATYDIGFGALSRVLASQTPVKMLVLDTGVYSNTGGQASTASYTGQNADLSRFGRAHPGKSERRKELPLLAMLHPEVFVASVSTAIHSHFLAASARLMGYTHGAGLLQVYTPCGFEHGFADELSNARAKLAVRSRMAPLFVHDPLAGDSLATRLSLDGNPEIDKAWATQNLWYTDEAGVSKVLTQPLTPAEFAYGETRFAKHFSKLDSNASLPTPIAEYAGLSANARTGRTPYIQATDNHGRLIKVSVSPSIVELVDDRQQNWQLLRYLAGRPASLAAAESAKALQQLNRALAEARNQREDGIDQIAHALAGLATAQDPSTVTLPHLGSTDVKVQVTVEGPPEPELDPTGSEPAKPPIWLAEEDIVKCTDCATCYQELPGLFEPYSIMVDGAIKNVSRLRPGAVDNLEVTPELEVVIERVKDSCDAEIIQ